MRCNENICVSDPFIRSKHAGSHFHSIYHTTKRRTYFLFFPKLKNTVSRTDLWDYLLWVVALAIKLLHLSEHPRLANLSTLVVVAFFWHSPSPTSMPKIGRQSTDATTQRMRDATMRRRSVVCDASCDMPTQRIRTTTRSDSTTSTRWFNIRALGSFRSAHIGLDVAVSLSYL